VGGVAFTNAVMDVEVDPVTPSNLVAAGYGTIWYSTNSGSTWTLASGLAAGSATTEVAYAQSNPLIVYAAVDNASDGTIYKSTNGGHTFTAVNVLGYFNGQGWYDNILWVDPTNANNVIAGGIDLWRSTNAGVSFSKISDWSNHVISAHADQHVIVAAAGFNGTTNKTI
jgi:hypothetical protein